MRKKEGRKTRFYKKSRVILFCFLAEANARGCSEYGRVIGVRERLRLLDPGTVLC